MVEYLTGISEIDYKLSSVRFALWLTWNFFVLMLRDERDIKRQLQWCMNIQTRNHLNSDAANCRRRQVMFSEPGQRRVRGTVWARESETAWASLWSHGTDGPETPVGVAWQLTSQNVKGVQAILERPAERTNSLTPPLHPARIQHAVSRL